MDEHQGRQAVRAAVADAFGPEVMRDVLETQEARSYIAALAGLRLKEAACRRLMEERAQDIAAELSAMLPEGMRFEWR